MMRGRGPGPVVGACPGNAAGRRRLTGGDQRGVALIFVLIMLALITVLGLTAMRGAFMQQKMAAQLEERARAFQRAEAAMHAAVVWLPGHVAALDRHCQLQNVVCPANPFDDAGLPAADIHTLVPQVSSDGKGGGGAQYVIEDFGQWSDPAAAAETAAGAYPAAALAVAASSAPRYYRITARSGDAAAAEGRTVVTLQAVFRAE